MDPSVISTERAFKASHCHARTTTAVKSTSGEAECCDGGVQGLGLFFQRFSRGCGLLHQRRVLLRGFVHERDGLVDLLDARALLVRGGGNFRP